MTARLFSVISPVHNAAGNLEDYFGSLEAQTIGLENLEIILVDDGSTDESLELCQGFAARHPGNVRVVAREHGGQAAARNAGLALATSPWVCFPDPNDVLGAIFFGAMHEYMAEAGSEATSLFAGHILLWDEETGQRTDTHATAFHFAAGNSTTDLAGKPNFVHGNVETSVFRRAVIVDGGLSFDERLRTRFQGESFLAQYLLQVDRPLLGLVQDARYFHRRRADATVADPRAYTDVPEFGYLAVLNLARKRHGDVPRWLQWLVINDVLLLFKVDVAKRAARSLPPEVLSSFHASLGEVMTFIEPESVLGFEMMRVPFWMREALAFGYSPDAHVGQVHLGPTDAGRGLIQIRYRFTGDPGEETIFVGGEKVAPRHTKTQTLRILGRALLKERSLWVSSLGAIRFEIDGRMREFAGREQPEASTYTFRRNQVLAAERAVSLRVPPQFRQFTGGMRARILAGCKQWVRTLRTTCTKEALYDLLLVTMMRFSGARRDFVGAWALLDREYEAGDNAEHLYRWMRDNRPEVKIWFVLRQESDDWERLKREGFRLVDLGSYRWKMLTLLVSHVVSSQATAYITNPLPAVRYGPPQWKLSFLQHGVIVSDLSSWLNKKSIEVFVASTEDEYRYIGGESTYKVGFKELRLTGMPRHDVLLEKSQAIAPADVDHILIAPTWRQYLAGRFIGLSVREKNHEFMDSEYAQGWKALVHSDELRDFASKNGLKVIFMPHPNLLPYLAEFDIPTWMEVRRYGQDDVQGTICRSAVMITDYSSVAFDMAYLSRPVVYYQFDKARYDAEHTGDKGYFDYEVHGFGPVTGDPAGVIESLTALWTDQSVAENFSARAARTFPVRDGRNSERVFNAIAELDRPLSFEQGSVAATPDSWAP